MSELTSSSYYSLFLARFIMLIGDGFCDEKSRLGIFKLLRLFLEFFCRVKGYTVSVTFLMLIFLGLSMDAILI